MWVRDWIAITIYRYLNARQFFEKLTESAEDRMPLGNFHARNPFQSTSNNQSVHFTKISLQIQEIMRQARAKWSRSSASFWCVCSSESFRLWMTERERKPNLAESFIDDVDDALFKIGSFEMHKWNVYSRSVLQSSSNDLTQEHKIMTKSRSICALGWVLYWFEVWS